jgi:hypothetical protein
MTVREWIKEHDDNLIVLEGPEFDKAIIGICDTFKGMAVAYDRETVIKVLMESGMNEEEAEEYFLFNTLGSYVGEHTPVYISSFKYMEWDY